VKLVLIVGGIFAALVLIGGVVVVALLPDDLLLSFGPQVPRTTVRSDVAVEGQLVEIISAPGEIEALKHVDISAEVSARIESLPHAEGESVARGDVVVRLDDRELRAALEFTKSRRDGEQFRLQSEGARMAGLAKTLEFARKTLERQQALYASGDVSRKDLDDAEERVEDLEASVEASAHTVSVIESSLAGAEADIERAEDALEKTVMRSPIDGVITLLNAEVGEVVVVGTMNNPGTIIMTIADLNRMILNARVAESDVAKIFEGAGARVHIKAYPDDVFAGTVRRIALQRTTALDGTGYFETEVEIDLAGQHIRSGHNANVDIEIAEHNGAVVPMQAIVDRVVDELPDAVRADPLVDRTKKVISVVYRVQDGKAVCTPILTGPSDWTSTLVREGLNPGDEIVTGPFKVLDELKHNALVNAEPEWADDETDEAGTETAELGGETATEADG
jgi:HlyD family secretion protein